MPSHVRVEPAVAVRLMGRFAVLRDGVEIPPAEFGGRKVRTMVRIFATRQGQFVSNDELTEFLWSEHAPADPAANLQVLVNRARRAMGTTTVIRTGPGGYALDASCVVDTEQFVSAVSAALALDDEASAAALAAALAGYSGEPLAEDRYEAWAGPHRDRILRARQDALERAAELAQRRGEFRAAVNYAAEAYAAEPLRETAALALVRALAAVGDHAAAIEYYEQYRRALADELGLDPSPAAAAVQAELLAIGTDGSAADVVQPAVARAVATRRGFDALRFSGRLAERAALLAAARSGGVIAVSGRSGAGKSRMLADVGWPMRTVAVRAYWPDRTEPWSLARAVLGEVLGADVAALQALPARLRGALASVVPDVDEPAPSDLDSESRRALVLEGAVRLVAALPDTAVIVDDAQWADPSSVSMLAAIADRLADVPLVIAYRSDELAADSALATLLRRVAANTIALDELDDDGISALIGDTELADAVRTATDRSPMALTEVLHALEREQLAAPDAEGVWRVLTAEAVQRAGELGVQGQRNAIARRADGFDPMITMVLSVLALLGRHTSVRTLARATAADEQLTLSALMNVAAAGLVRPGDEGWAMAHDMVADVIAERVDDAERVRLHSVIARALEAEDADAAEIARHWARAGETTRAAEAFGIAAGAAQDAFADTEAEALADAGLRVGAPPALEARLLAIRGAARARRGDIAGARTDLRAASTGYGPGAQRAIVLTDLAMLAFGADDVMRAAELAEVAIVEAGDDRPARARALEVAAIVDMNRAEPERAELRAAEALAIFRESGDARGAARIHDGRAMATFLSGDITTATQLLDRAANLFEDSGDLIRMLTPRTTCGHGRVLAGDPESGLVEVSLALEVARSLGHPEGLAYASWHCAEAYAAMGRVDEARQAAHDALAHASGIGHRGWTATAWRAVGIAEQRAGDLDAALDAFTASHELSQHFDLFACWAAARSAMVLVQLGRLDEASAQVVIALGTGPPLGQYEARLAQVSLAQARTDAATPELAARALQLAIAGGYGSHVPQLSALAAGQ